MSHPSLGIDQGDDFGRDAQQVRGDSQDTVAVRCCRSFHFATGSIFVWRATNLDQSNLVIRCGGVLTRLSRQHDLSAQYIGLSRRFRKCSLLEDFINTVVTKATNIAVHFEVRVQPPLHQTAALRLFQQRSLHQVGKCRDNRTVDECDRLVNLTEPVIASYRCCLLIKFLDNLLETIGIKNARRFTERTERHPFATELLLDLLQFARLRDGSFEQRQ